MRSIETHPGLYKLLHKWAGDNKVITATYYFWSAGQLLEKSVMGLLRSLLHQSLLQHPGLLEWVFPIDAPEWSMASADYEFTVLKLREAFKRMLNHGVRLQLRFFFLIDGLDEIDQREKKEDESDLKGQHALIELVRDFSEYPILRVCLSSRPWNIFEKEYGCEGRSHLQLHKITRNDIETYTRGTLEKDMAFQELIERDKSFKYGQLVNEILDAANGVFLWVQLAVRNLLSGIDDGNGLYELQERLHTLPFDLHKMYDHILSTVEPEYLELAGRYLLMAASDTTHDLGLMVFLYSGKQESAMLTKHESLTLEEYVHAHISMGKKINACCKGLLEV
ncbi:hypothetical protein K491DRAFT_609623, partial [Lophiostoma macrostomum CBS 122681]